jgi:cytochrome b subunit of formate dehydrogenase
VVDTYRETVHGKMVALGNEKAAGCSDCHTGHEIFALEDSRSSVHPDNRAEMCRECHENATDSFTAAISHRPHTIDADFWAWFTALAFSVLTVGTVLMLFIHLLLDLFNAGRSIFNHAEEQHGTDEAPLAADDQVERLDGHIRLQHVLMIVSFVALVLTGWPLKSAAVGISSGFAQALGGHAVLALVHRIAGCVLIGVSVYHLAYLALRFRRGQLGTSMIPGSKDLTDLVGNILYYLGIRKERPKFGVFTYYEKFDYWAIFWGVPLMAGTGLILWFPELTARLLPGDFITLAFIAHSDEALLAALAIFLWHFYNQHLRPSVFPMSWAWITGRITADALYDEHRGEYERQYGSGPPRAPVHTPSWNEHPLWSFAALAVVLVAAAVVLVWDVSSVRQQLASLDTHAAAIELVALTAGEPGVIGAFDEGFEPWETCFACHNETRFESDEEHFPHKLHFEDEELDDDCTSCHESIFHESFGTDLEGCFECHDADEIDLLEGESA